MRCPNPAKTVAENEIASTIDCLDNQSNQDARRCLRLDNRLPRQSIKPKRKALPKGIPINSTPKPSTSKKTRPSGHFIKAAGPSGRLIKAGQARWPFYQGRWLFDAASMPVLSRICGQKWSNGQIFKFGLQMASFTEARMKNLSAAGRAIFFYQSQPQRPLPSGHFIKAAGPSGRLIKAGQARWPFYQGRWPFF